MRVDSSLNQATMHADRGRPGGWRPGIVGLALLGLIAVLLMGDFLADQQLRPRVGIDSAPVPAATAKPTEAPAVSSAPTSLPAAGPTAAAGTPTSAVGPGELRVGSSPLEREVEAAYLKYWDIRAEALLNLDPSRLSEVMAGAELQRTREQIAELKAQGRAAKIVVEHRIAFLKVTEQTAELYDEYMNKSYLVDSSTRQPVGSPGPGGVAKVTYRLEKSGGVWRVVDGTRHE